MAALEIIETESGPNPTATIIVLHGLGADGNDFVPVARELDLAQVGPVRFVFPHAPVMPVTINNGYRMRAWYDIAAPDLLEGEDEDGLRRSQGAVEALIEREKTRGIAPARIVVAGFSQGCAISLMTGVRQREALAGIAGLSGYLPLAQKVAAEATAASRSTPIFLGHGRQDAVVPLAGGQASRDMLRALGYDVEWHDYPMAHSVCAEEIEDLNAWLHKVLAKR